MTSQSADNNTNAITVQNTGNNVAITVGGITLTFERKHLLSTRPATTDLHLLIPEYRQSTLVGRDADLAGLHHWRTSGKSIAARCLTGQAGAGKTRLAIDFCEQTEAAGWQAGFLHHASLAHDLSAWRWQKPTLVVIDYAAASARPLRIWLDSLAKRPDDLPPLRLLLLERYATPAAGWFQDVFGPGTLIMGAPDLLAPAEPIKLRPLASLADRRALLTDIMTKAATLADKPIPTLPAPGADPEFDRKLAQDGLDHAPLYLAMAGIVAVASGAPAALALGRTDLATRLAAAERTRLARRATAGKIDPALFTHFAACITLANGCTRDAGETMIAEERAAMGYPADAPAEGLAALLHDTLPAANDSIDAIRPDLIGKAFLLLDLTHDARTVTRQQAIIARAFRRDGMPVLQTIIRTAQDHCAGKPDHPSLLWLDRLATLTDDLFALIAISNELPHDSVGLRERAAAITQRLVDALRPRAATDPSLLPPLAANLNNLAKRLSELGQWEAALAAAQEAVARYAPWPPRDPTPSSPFWRAR